MCIDPFLAQVIEARENPGTPLRLTARKRDYYLKKYDLLEQNGYFEPPDTGATISGRYTGESLEAYLHNNRQVVFEVTDACNLKCKYCGYGEFYGGYDRRENRNLRVRDARALLDFMTSYWNSPGNFSYHKGIRIGFYGGEPLLNFPFVREIVEYARQIPLLRNHFTFGMTTNGVLLDKYIGYLVENDFQLLVSLDGDEAGNRFRVFHSGKPSYETIYRNVCRIRETYPGYFEKNVRFASVLHRLNSVEGIYRYFDAHFDKIPVISDISPHGIKESMREEFEKIYVNRGDSFARAQSPVKNKAVKELRGDPVRHVADILHHYSADTFKEIQDLLPGGATWKIPTGTCIPLNRKIFLSVNCKILPCERVSAAHALGTVEDCRVRIDFQAAAEKYNRRFDRLAPQCTACYSTGKCSNCILRMDEHRSTSTCPVFTGPQQFRDYLSRGMSFLEEHPELYKKIVREYFLE